MRRREFIALLGGAAAAWPVEARAQQSGKLPIIGFLGAGRLQRGHGPRPSCSGCANSAGSRAAPSRSSIAGRRDETSAGRDRGRFVQLNVDVVVTGTPGISAAKQATSAIPIVFALAGDPVGTGTVASLARPGGNVTGMSSQTAEIAGKRLELLREVVPGLRRLAIMANAGNPAIMLEMGEVQAVAQRSASKSPAGNPASRGYRARLRGAQRARGSALCPRRPDRPQQPYQHQHVGD